MMNVVHGIVEYMSFFMLVWDRRKEILYGNGSACNVGQTNSSQECEANGISALAVDMSDYYQPTLHIHYLCITRFPLCFPIPYRLYFSRDTNFANATGIREN